MNRRPAQRALSIPVALSFLLISAGCLSSAPARDDRVTDALYFPLGPLQVGFSGAPDVPVSIGRPEQRPDAWGNMRTVIPISVPGVMPIESPEPYVSYYDPGVSEHVQFGTTFAYRPEHDATVPYYTWAMLVAFGLRTPDAFPEWGRSTRVTSTGEWNYHQYSADGDELVVVETERGLQGEASIEYRYEPSNPVPSTIEVRRWTFATPLVRLEHTLPLVIGVVSAEPAAKDAGEAYEPTQDDAGEVQTFEAKQLAYYPTGGDSGFHGPPSDDARLAPFSLAEALAELARHPTVADYAQQTENPFVLQATRVGSSGAQGQQARATWTVSLGDGCAGGTGHKPMNALRAVIVKELEPAPLPARVDEADTWRCTDSDVGGVLASWEGLPRRMIAIDDLLSSPSLPGRDAALVRWNDRIELNFRSSCIPESLWANKLGYHDGLTQDFHWVSVINGQLLQSQPRAGTGTAPPGASILECGTSMPGTF